MSQKKTRKPSWKATDLECMADNGYFRGGGFSIQIMRQELPMPATMIRLNLVKGLGPVLQIAEGWTVELPAGCI